MREKEEQIQLNGLRCGGEGGGGWSTTASSYWGAAMSKKNTRTHMLMNPKQLPQNICKHFNPSDHVTTGDSPPPVLTVLSKHAVRLSVQTPTMHYSTGFG